MYGLRVDGSEIRPSPPGMYKTLYEYWDIDYCTATGGGFLPSTLFIKV